MQVALWYASLYLVFLWMYGSTTGIWRYGLKWKEAKPVGAILFVPVQLLVCFALW
jgi:hypothetical protein